jgi:hypothetical protein
MILYNRYQCCVKFPNTGFNFMIDLCVALGEGHDFSEITFEI